MTLIQYQPPSPVFPAADRTLTVRFDRALTNIESALLMAIPGYRSLRKVDGVSVASFVRFGRADQVPARLERDVDQILRVRCEITEVPLVDDWRPGIA